MHTARARKSLWLPPFGRAASQPAFTLIELVVVLTIVAILASLTLAGLAGTRHRAKIDRTKSTIRKLHELIVPHYESYVRRRVPIAGVTPIERATSRLVRQRFLAAAELPDRWLDVNPAGPLPLVTGPMRAYAQYKAGLIANAQNTEWADNRDRYEGAECLAMIVMCGGIDSHAMEQFRADELGDIDRDGAAEFWDAWGRPIGFIRWPAGFSSSLQSRDASTSPDPFDPSGVTARTEYPLGITQRDYATIPLIYSAGPDEVLNDPLGDASGYGIDTIGPPSGWIASLLSTPPLLTTRYGSPSTAPGATLPNAAHVDNVTNHDLLAK